MEAGDPVIDKCSVFRLKVGSIDQLRLLWALFSPFRALTAGTIFLASLHGRLLREYLIWGSANVGRRWLILRLQQHSHSLVRQNLTIAWPLNLTRRCLRGSVGPYSCTLKRPLGSLIFQDLQLSVSVVLSAPHAFGQSLEFLDESRHPHMGSFIDLCTLILGVLGTTFTEGLDEAELVHFLITAHGQRCKASRDEVHALYRTALVQVVEDELVAECVPFLGRQQLLVIGRRHHLDQNFSCLEPLALKQDVGFDLWQHAFLDVCLRVPATGEVLVGHFGKILPNLLVDSLQIALVRFDHVRNIWFVFDEVLEVAAESKVDR